MNELEEATYRIVQNATLTGAVICNNFESLCSFDDHVRTAFLMNSLYIFEREYD